MRYVVAVTGKFSLGVADDARTRTSATGRLRAVRREAADKARRHDLLYLEAWILQNVLAADGRHEGAEQPRYFRASGEATLGWADLDLYWVCNLPQLPFSPYAVQ